MASLKASDIVVVTKLDRSSLVERPSPAFPGVAGGASDIACAAADCGGWSGACKYQQLRCFARSVRKYQWLPAGAGEFGAVRQSSARAVFIGTPTPAHHQTRSVGCVSVHLGGPGGPITGLLLQTLSLVCCECNFERIYKLQETAFPGTTV
jgi:hypothetical protein